MNDKQNEMADFLLSQFVDGCVNRDDMLDSIYDKYDNDITPDSVLQTLKDDGLIYDWGEAYYKLTENGVKAAKKGYGKYKSQQTLRQNVGENSQQTHHTRQVPLWHRWLHSGMACQGLSRCPWHVG